jgi:galactose mutarotase-like enzyme
MPVSFGFHPYFLKNKLNAKLTIPSEKTIEVNGVMIPTGKLSTKENKWNFIEDKVSLQNVSFDDGFQDLKLNENKQAVFAFNNINVVYSMKIFHSHKFMHQPILKNHMCA